MNLEIEEQIDSIKYFLDYYKQNCYDKMKIIWINESNRKYTSEIKDYFERLGYEVYTQELFDKFGSTIIDLIIKI